MAVPRAKKAKPNKQAETEKWIAEGFKEGYAQGYDKGCDEMGDLFMTLFYTAMKDECNLKAEKVNKVIKRADRYAMALRDGTITYKDMYDDLVKNNVDMTSFKKPIGGI